MADPASPVLAPKVQNLFFDAHGNWIPSTYKGMRGGRGGLKSWGFASVAVLLAAKRKTRFLCTREYQKSIRDSVHFTLRSQIERFKLEPYFEITRESIRSYLGSEFIFKGVHHDPDGIKSTEGIDVCWVEEAQSVSEASWDILIPTIIRKPSAEIWVSFNPDLEKDATSQKFLVNPLPDLRMIETGWRDNPWLPKAMLDAKDYLARVDPDAYAHVWEGQYRRNSEAQVLKGKCSIEAFEPAKEWSGPYYGVDWGFSVDPSAMVRCWIHENRLYVEHEAYKVGVDTIDLPNLFKPMPGSASHVSRADNSRPEHISHCRQHGFPRMTAVDKWPGSVEDGVQHLRSYEKIIIHPRCDHFREEALLWSYKTDKKSGDVLPELLDKHNHLMDAIRYALEPMIKRRTARITELRI